MEDRRDRQQPMADHHHHRSRMPKKGGAGGTYTWGGPMDVTADEASYEPLGMQGPQKVTTDEAAAAPPPPVPQPEVHLESAEEFPALPASSAGGAAAPAEAAGPHAEAAEAAAHVAPGSVWATRLEAAGEDLPQEAAAPSGAGTTAGTWVAKAWGSLRKAASERVGAPVKERLASAIAAAASARDAAVAGVASVRGAASAGYGGIREKGLASWAIDQARAAKDAACVAAGATKARGAESLKGVRARSAAVLSSTLETARDATKTASDRASELATGTSKVVRDTSFQATAASAAGGAMVLGTGGGAAGLVTGTMFGAAVGLVPALFTFGLSIPIGAAIGGGTGLLAGAAGGTAIGAVGGGAAGYGVYTRRERIAGVAKQASNKVSESADYIKGQAAVVRTRLVGGGTGSTEDRD